ncbi:A-kinase anchor protein 14 isoform X2 [Hydra vulgaris]|uniref:A-kinase anchor protein 14 isoform X2 n=1 Tax=Hydra vulgaris TaxID=6087 RepID=A0ABM4B5Q5_HYDVU
MDFEKDDLYSLEAKLLINSFINNTYDELTKNTFINDKDKLDWMTIDEFSIDRGKAKIKEFILTWKVSCNFLYCIFFIGEDQKKYSKRFRYKVQWSIPTCKKPIPRATASVYFVIDVSTVKPKNFPVNVYFVFETNRLVHRPGDPLSFCEKWLNDIIESKVLLMDAIKF